MAVPVWLAALIAVASALLGMALAVGLMSFVRRRESAVTPLGAGGAGNSADSGVVDWPVPPEPGRPAYRGVPAAEVHQVLLGGDRVLVTLTAGPGEPGGRPSGRYVAWAPLPYDTPDGGVAFACLGSGDQGCLFLDLGRAPGMITVGGDRRAVARLAESVAHQLCAAPDGRRPAVLTVGNALPPPHPAGVIRLAGLDRLERALSAAGGETTAIVFCVVNSEADALALKNLVAGSSYRFTPVALNGPPEALWSLTVVPAVSTSRAPHG
jgi:hypothetical protein